MNPERRSPRLAPWWLLVALSWALTAACAPQAGLPTQPQATSSTSGTEATPSTPVATSSTGGSVVPVINF